MKSRCTQDFLPFSPETRDLCRLAQTCTVQHLGLDGKSPLRCAILTKPKWLDVVTNSRASHFMKIRLAVIYKYIKIHSLTQLSVKQLLLKKNSTSYLTATCFGSFLRSHLQVGLFKKVLYTRRNKPTISNGR